MEFYNYLSFDTPNILINKFIKKLYQFSFLLHYCFSIYQPPMGPMGPMGHMGPPGPPGHWGGPMGGPGHNGPPNQVRVVGVLCCQNFLVVFFSYSEISGQFELLVHINLSSIGFLFENYF